MQIDPVTPQDFRPAARDALAAAGPVEPSSSPELAPGPTLSPVPKPRTNYFRSRKTQALVNHARTLYRRGETYSGIGRALGITSDTARRWLDPDYDSYRRRAATGNVAVLNGDDEAILPTLPFIPGVIVSGRYRMKPQSIGPKSGGRFSDKPMREK